MNLKSTIVHALAAATFTGGMIYCASRLEIAAERPYDVEILPHPSAMRWLSFGHPTLVANLYWLRTVQYVGESRANARGWIRLKPLADLVTDLDPKHGYVYQVAGTLLSSLNRIEESNDILEKGIKALPKRWNLYSLRGFNAFYYQDDYPLAGKYFETAATLPGAPEHMRESALSMYVKGRRSEAAIRFLSLMYDLALDPESRTAIQEQLHQAILERDVLTVEEAMVKYQKNHGKRAATLQALVDEKLIERVPPDPFGGDYRIDPEGRVRSSVHTFRFSPPKTPGQIIELEQQKRDALPKELRLE